MKKFLLLIVLLSCSPLFSAFNYLGLGMNVGLGFNNYWGHKDKTLLAPGIAYSVSAFMPIKFMDELAVELGIGYYSGSSVIIENVSIENPSINKIKKYRDTTFSLLIPLVLKYYPANGFNLQLGTYSRYIFILDRVFAKNSNRNGNNDYKSFDMGPLFGMALEIVGLQIQIRYHLGVLPIYKISEQENIKQSFFLFSIGYFFELI